MRRKKYAARDVGNSLLILSRADVVENHVVLSFFTLKMEAVLFSEMLVFLFQIPGLITENQGG
jgi:hypothetical protein